MIYLSIKGQRKQGCETLKTKKEMRNLLFHIVRVLRKFGLLMFLAFVISPINGVVVLVIATVISMVFFKETVEEKNPEDYFTDEELRKIESGEEMYDEEYLTLLAKYESYKCPVKVDEITTWTGSEVTNDSYIYNYEINDKKHKYGEIDMDVLKSNILARIDKNGNNAKRIIATNRNMIYRYWDGQTGSCQDVVVSTDELKNL